MCDASDFLQMRCTGWYIEMALSSGGLFCGQDVGVIPPLLENDRLRSVAPEAEEEEYEAASRTSGTEW